MDIPPNSVIAAFMAAQVAWFLGILLYRRRSARAFSLFIFIHPKSFPELSQFSFYERVRLFEEACSAASRSWRWLPPALVFLAGTAVAIAFGRVTSTGLGLGAEGGVCSLASGVFAWLCAMLILWLMAKLSVWGVRPFLHRAIARAGAA